MKMNNGNWFFFLLKCSKTIDGSTNGEIVSINKVKEKFTPETKHRTIATTSAVAAKYVNQLQESENQHRASTNKIGTHNKAYDFSDIQRDVILGEHNSVCASNI